MTHTHFGFGLCHPFCHPTPTPGHRCRGGPLRPAAVHKMGTLKIGTGPRVARVSSPCNSTPKRVSPPKEETTPTRKKSTWKQGWQQAPARPKFGQPAFQTSHFELAYPRLCLCVCVCVCERERERDKEYDAESMLLIGQSKLVLDLNTNVFKFIFTQSMLAVPPSIHK